MILEDGSLKDHENEMEIIFVGLGWGNLVIWDKGFLW